MDLAPGLLSRFLILLLLGFRHASLHLQDALLCDLSLAYLQFFKVLVLMVFNKGVNLGHSVSRLRELNPLQLVGTDLLGEGWLAVTMLVVIHVAVVSLTSSLL